MSEPEPIYVTRPTTIRQFCDELGITIFRTDFFRYASGQGIGADDEHDKTAIVQLWCEFTADVRSNKWGASPLW